MRWCFATIVVIIGSSPLSAERLFEEGIEFPLNSEGSFFISRDLNKDLRDDLIIIHSAAAEVSVLLSDSESYFSDAQSYKVGLNPLHLESDDLNGDTFPDIFVTNSGSSTISVLLNRGDGHFDILEPISVGISPRLGKVADFDGDGNLDAVTSNLISHDLTILLGDGKGNFTEKGRLDIGDEPHALIITDLNKDELPDIVIGRNSPNNEGTVSWFFGLGDANFGPLVSLPLDAEGRQNPKWFAPGDFDNNGNLDLAILTEDGNLVMLRNPGTKSEAMELVSEGSLPFLNPFTSTNFIPFLETADFDGDGHLDLIWPLERLGEFGIRINYGQGDGTFPREDFLILGSSYSVVEISDLDNDGMLDAVSSFVDRKSVTLFEGIRLGTFRGLRTTIMFEKSPRDIAVMDVNHDRLQDLVALSSRTLHFIPSMASAGFDSAMDHEFADKALTDLVIADFNNDGKLDLAMTDLLAGEVVLLFFDDTGSIIENQMEYRVNNLPAEMVAIDFDNDGYIDIAVGDQSSTNFSLLLHPGKQAKQELSQIPLGAPQTGIASADIDGDEKMDLAFSTRQSIKIVYGDGAGGFPRAQNIDSIINAIAFEFSDMDSNGEADLVYVSQNKVNILYSVANSGDQDKTEMEFDVEIHALMIDDLDSDDHLDLLTTSVGEVLVMRGKAEKEFHDPEAYLVGSNPSSLVTADLDGDGILDCATANSDSRSLSVLRGSPPKRSQSALHKRRPRF